MIRFDKTINLTNEEIESAVAECVSVYEKYAKKRAADKVKLALSIEEVLLRMRECSDENTPCRIRLNKSFSEITFIFKQKGKQFPKPDAKDETEELAYDILSLMELHPKLYYDAHRNVNTVVLPAKQKPRQNSAIYSTAIAVALAIACYLIVAVHPDSVQTVISEDFTIPIFNKMIAIITTVATPLIFFSVINGISEIGDISAVGSIGVKFLNGVFNTYLLAGITFSALCAFAYSMSSAGSVASVGFVKDLVQLVLDIVPDNLLNPFVVDNDLQVVTVSVFIGVVLILMRKKADPVKSVIHLLSDITNKMMGLALKLVPPIVFLGIFNMLCSDMSGFSRMYIVVIVFVVGSAVPVLYLVLRTRFTFKVPIKILFKKQLPTTMINLTTSSQVSALPENMICCIHKFGIDKKLVNFGLPLGIVIYMPCGAIFLGSTVWALSDLAGVQLGITQLILTMVLAIIIGIAAPPIPGSALAVLPMMMSVSGIPQSVFPVAVILGTVLGYFLPLFNGYCLQLELLLTAKKLNMVDEEILRTPVEDLEIPELEI